MPLMREYTEIIVEEEILPQVVRELVVLATDQNHVEVTHGVSGRVILVHPDLAETWYQKVTAKSDDPDEVPIPVPVIREPGRPRKIQPAPSVSNGEES